MDVFFRTGPIGLLCYLGIFIAVLRYLKHHQEGLFWGVLAVGVYGLFHETFKESQGGFLYAVLVGMMAQSVRERREARRALSEPTQPRSTSTLPAPLPMPS
jgi:hypothetical protein